MKATFGSLIRGWSSLWGGSQKTGGVILLKWAPSGGHTFEIDVIGGVILLKLHSLGDHTFDISAILDP